MLNGVSLCHPRPLHHGCRGLNSLARRKVVRDMVQSINPMIVCLQEAEVAVFSSQLVAETIG
jgi:mRNA deadenylase 3'-5' endonuclease subunit Ccr4